MPWSVWIEISWSGIFGDEISDPNTPCPLRDRLAFSIHDSRAHPTGKELFDDPSLCGDCNLRAGTASARVLHGEVKRCRPGYVFLDWIGARVEQTGDSVGAARANRPVQWRGAIFVTCVDVRPRVQ